MPMAVILVILGLLNSEDLEDGDGDDGDVGKRDGDNDCNGSAGNHRHRDIFLSHISLL